MQCFCTLSGATCYGDLVTPNLASGVKLNGKLLLKMCGQGSVYIRSLINLDEEASESDEELLTSFMGTSQPQKSPPSDAREHDTAPSNDEQVSDPSTTIADYDNNFNSKISNFRKNKLNGKSVLN